MRLDDVARRGAEGRGVGEVGVGVGVQSRVVHLAVKEEAEIFGASEVAHRVLGRLDVGGAVALHEGGHGGAQGREIRSADGGEVLDHADVRLEGEGDGVRVLGLSVSRLSELDFAVQRRGDWVGVGHAEAFEEGSWDVGTLIVRSA